MFPSDPNFGFRLDGTSNSGHQNLMFGHYDGRGWVQWPNNEDYSFHFMNVLAASQGGGSTIAECLSVASRIIPGDDESWFREWKKIGDANTIRGDAAAATGNFGSARGHWLRATIYYQASEIFLCTEDARRTAAVDRMRESAGKFIRILDPPGELVEIPRANGTTMQGYFLCPPAAATMMPAVICFGGLNQFKEEYLHKFLPQAHFRKLSLLLIDLPGSGLVEVDQSDGVHATEASISECVDYLASRGDVDNERIVILGDGLGASFAWRAANADTRFTASVCDAGIWDIYERSYSRNWVFGQKSREPLDLELEQELRSNMLAGITCPTLMVFGEHDWFDKSCVQIARRLLEELDVEITLRMFTAEETGSMHAQGDNPTLGSEFIFDWIAKQVQAPPN